MTEVGLGWVKWMKNIKRYKLSVKISHEDVIYSMVTIKLKYSITQLRVAKRKDLNSHHKENIPVITYGDSLWRLICFYTNIELCYTHQTLI